MKENNCARSNRHLVLTILVWVLACVCLPFAELKAEASGSLYFNGTTNSYMQFSGPFYGGSVSSGGSGGSRSNGGIYYGDYSVEFWFRPDAITNQTVFSSFGTLYGSYQTSYVISTLSDGSINVAATKYCFDCSFNFNINFNSGPNLITAGQWQHVAIVTEQWGYEFPANSGRIFQLNYIYINGILVSTNAYTADRSFDSTINWAADSPPTLGKGYSGAIGELREWSRALSQTEIQTNMTRVLNPTNESFLFGYWRFTEGSSNVVYDLTGTNNGIIHGASWNADSPNTALQPPSIIQQPTNQTVFNGMSNVVFSVAANGSQPFTYQWLFNSTNIPGATGSAYAIAKASLTNLGVYSVIVTNTVGSITSSNAALTMYPFLSSLFAGTTVLWGQNANLSVSPAGTGPFAYQWYENGVPISGATNQTYTISSIQFTNAGFYSAVVTSAFGSVTNTPAQLVVNPAGVSIGMYPGVTITGTIGYSYTIQSTPNLSDTNGWITNTNLTLQATQQLWFDSSINAYNPGNPQRFYRVLPQQ